MHAVSKGVELAGRHYRVHRSLALREGISATVLDTPGLGSAPSVPWG